ncbi:hypothetical protein B4U79_12995 [Dinothrombium tinctorium]|uniref:Uncharacterized protein n=1 Tax=Dinothrombium tinctorium TaxID=1965070 RepID=A0A3S3S9V5_9ACAR|nr:hypothetical protein B4U79_12995 [Dinothrombium tinctorium]
MSGNSSAISSSPVVTDEQRSKTLAGVECTAATGTSAVHTATTASLTYINNDLKRIQSEHRSITDSANMVNRSPQRKQSIFVAPPGLNAIISSSGLRRTMCTAIATNTPTTPATTASSAISVLTATTGNSSNAERISPPLPAKKTSSTLLPKANAHDLEQHISKIISENAAIVETLDPLWSKRYHSSRHSTSSIPSSQRPVSPHTKKMSNDNDDSTLNSSKLQSALMGRSVVPTATTATVVGPRKFSEGVYPSVIISVKQLKQQQQQQQQQSDGEGSSLVRNLLTAKAPSIKVTPAPVTAPEPKGVHPENPEGSIIRDLLLKARDNTERKVSRTQSPVPVIAQPVPPSPITIPQCEPPSQLNKQDSTVIGTQSQELSMLVYVCTICKIAFRNKENLDIHQMHYCKEGSDQRKAYPDSNAGCNINQLQVLSDHVQRKISVMESPFLHQQLTKPKAATAVRPLTATTTTVSSPPVGNILKQQLLAPQQGHPLKKRKISEPVFPSASYSARGGGLMTSNFDAATDSAASRKVSVLHHMMTKTTSSAVTVASIAKPVNSGPLVLQQNSSSSWPSSNRYIPLMSTQSSRQKVIQEPVNNATRSSSSLDSPSGKIDFEVLPDYFPHMKCPSTKITVIEPIVFPVLRKILFENKDNIEFQSKDKCVNNANCDVSKEQKTACSPLKQVASLNFDEDESNLNSDEVSEDTSETTTTSTKASESVTTINSTSSSSTENEVQSMTSASRPTSLPTQKRKLSAFNLIGSTLVSPETPRPKKNCVQLYINGHAYTYIGLKVSTKSFFCCIYRPQPMFVVQETQPKLSMYSNWQPRAVHDEIFNLVPPPTLIATYDSRRNLKPAKSSVYSTAVVKISANNDQNTVVTNSASWSLRKKEELKEKLKTREEVKRKLNDETFENPIDRESSYRKISEDRSSTGFDSDSGEQPKRVKIFEGGYKSTEDYTYVRGRGRGKYVCEECGIRCKKPSMLKKHIRTHTDLRPYSCRNCAFAFKTKGNLTKHMKSKAHHKKCIELGIIPVPTTIDESQIDSEALAKQEAIERTYGGGNLASDDDENDVDDDDGYEDDEEEGSDDEGVPIPLINTTSVINLQPSLKSTTAAQFQDKYEKVNTSEELKIQQKDNDEKMKDRDSESNNSALTANEDEHEVAQSLLVLSGSEDWVESKKCPVNLLSARKEEKQHSFDEKQTFNNAPKNIELQNPSVYLSSNILSNNSLFTRQRSFSFNENLTRDNPLPSTSSQDSAKLEDRNRLSAEPISTDDSDESETYDEQCLTRRYSMSNIRENNSNRGIHWRPSSMSPHSEESNSKNDDLQPMDLSKRTESEDIFLESPEPLLPLDGQSVVIPNSNNLTQSPMVINRLEFMPRGQPAGQGGEEGKSTCSVCNKSFSKPSQLRLHVNIHYFERPFRCDACAVSFRTKGHLQKHKRSSSHLNKLNMNMTFGTPTTDNPRPFKCGDCKIAFRIHGHLAKHLRSKMHIMKLECLGKLPFGMYAEMERSGVSLNDIDTTDCDNSLQSLQMMAKKMYAKSDVDLRSVRWMHSTTTDVESPSESGSQEDEDMLHPYLD